MAGARDILAELLFVRGKNADATSPAGNGHIPLLRVSRSLDGRIRKQDVIHRLALRTVGRNGVARKKLAKARIQDPAVTQFNPTIEKNREVRGSKRALAVAERGGVITIWDYSAPQKLDRF
jgi:hypothetical protein